MIKNLKLKRRLFVFAAVVALLCLTAAPSFALNKGAQAPNFTLSDVNEESISLVDLRGKVVVLNFWATWCPPCRSEMPEFDELDKEFKESSEAVLLAVNLTDGSRETKAKVQKFLDANGYGMRVLLDIGTRTAKAYNVMGIPTTLVINPKGIVSEVIVGATTKDAVLEAVKKALK